MRCRNVSPCAPSIQSFLFLTLSLVLACPLFGQVAGGTLVGTVTDTSGAVIPNAQITIKDVATSVTRTVLSDSAGLYTAPNLLPGAYEVTASAVGFATEVQSGITITVGAHQELNFQMHVGQITNKIEVSTQPPTVDLADSTLSAFVSSTTVQELPLNGRDWTQLATLQPGVNGVGSLQASITSSQRGTRGYGVDMAIAGSRPSENSYRIDGINVNDTEGGGPASVSGASLGVDAIQEFSVLMSNYSAEYGRTAGGVINAITRSGTNQIHGDAYEFLRNSALDARNFFDGATIPPFKRNQFGGSVGGPIRRDRTFFFGDFEGFRQNLGVTAVDTVPSLDARNGIIYTKQSNGTITSSTVTVSPSVQPFLGLWAPPNGAILSPGNTGIFTFAGSQVIGENFATARLDHKISDKDSLFGSWQFDKSNLTLPDSLDDSYVLSNTQRQFYAIEETHIFSPRLVNSLRVGYNRSSVVNGFSGPAINPLSADMSLSAVPGIGAPQISVPGLTSFGGGINSPSRTAFTTNAFQGYDDLFFTKGIQSLKFGVAVERDQQRQYQASTVGGQFKFGSLANFLTNKPKSFAAAFPGAITYMGMRQTIVGGYLQDDVRLRPNLTVNLGVRYEIATVPTEVQNKLSVLRSPTDPAPHIGSPLFNNPTMTNLEPRTGFAWDPFKNGKTSIRGSFGLFDILPLTPLVTHPLLSSAPFVLQGSTSSLTAGSFPSGAFPLIAASPHLRTGDIEPNPSRNYAMQWNFNVERQLTPNLAARVAYVGSRTVHGSFYVSDFNMVIPTQSSAGYLWPIPSPSVIVLNQARGRIDYLDWGSRASYDSMQVQVTRRMNHGFQAQASYTWGKSIDQGDPGTSADTFLNSLSSELWFDRNLARGLSDFNVSQNLTVNYTWVIPTPRSFHGPAALIAGGWQLGGILTLDTGLPFTPLLAGGGDPLGMNSADPFDYPDRLTGPGCQSVVNPGNVHNYIKLNCFAVPMATSAIAAQCTAFSSVPGSCQNLFGNAGRNSITGPGLANLDFSVFKNTPVARISETFNVQFRLEVFNILNRANFNSPIDNNTIFDVTGAAVPGAGLIDGTSTTAREIQFALKLIW